MTNRIRAAVCSALTASAIFASAGSLAEEGPPAAANSQAGSPAGELQEIVVTAERRSESAQNAPAPIDVVSADKLAAANITNLQEMSRLAPSVQNGTAGGPFALFFIRGVGSFAANSLTDAAIAVNLDDVPLARQYDTAGQFYDLARVEVLKGPQGTLYGRNATGGAINIVPEHPSFDSEGNVGVTVGNYHHEQTDGVLNVPLTDDSAFRLSFQTIRHDGYLSDGEADEDSQAARLQYRIDPAERLSITLSADYFHQGGEGGGNALLDGGYTAADRIGLADPRAQAYYASLGLVPVTPRQLFIDGNYGGGKVELTWGSDLGELVVIPGYRTADYSSEAISGPLLIDSEHDHQESLEARYSFHEMAGLRLIIGAFYLDDSVRARFNVDNLAVNTTLPSSGNIQDFLQETHSSAGFADATYSITDALRLIGGVRYTNEKKSLDGTLTTYAAFIPPLLIDQSRTWDATNWRAGLEYDLAAKSMVYATVATGFHSGGFFFTHDNPSYQPETLKAYTLGSKNRWLNNTMQVNVEAFYWDYQNQQLSGVSSDSTGSTIFATVNAAASRIKGLEADTQYLLAEHTLIGLDAQYLNSKFDNFRFIQPFPVSPLSACTSAFVSKGHFNVNCSGLRPPQAPEWTVNLDLRQTFPLHDGATIVADLSGHYQTQTYMAMNYLPTDLQKAYTRGDLNVTYNARDDRWSLTAFCNNFTNVAIMDSTNHPNVDSAALRAPRLYGARVTMHF